MGMLLLSTKIDTLSNIFAQVPGNFILVDTDRAYEGRIEKLISVLDYNKDKSYHIDMDIKKIGDKIVMYLTKCTESSLIDTNTEDKKITLEQYKSDLVFKEIPVPSIKGEDISSKSILFLSQPLSKIVYEVEYKPDMKPLTDNTFPLLLGI